MVRGKRWVISERVGGRDDEDSEREATAVVAKPEATAAVAKPEEDPWDGFPLDESVFRDG
ncbi:hypothetical protein ABZ816_26895 [Actinosynnema sp. NPDC047251]|uniref:Uncharacterized protein n=1 Tax=Saccharothrix espanaensis (strain ATCC 51144 / DSM 44229 / JCM 9112 / NBRC 15066 / NRRL 15764) TaxID=1179773 RepID=K0K0V8_SACES|nr:hypothetical protein [Saccharothrix espanaensis]CCH31981.1 hypothetical protein BN6_47020 [Saccharothrix espanaensis DSM 44229]